MSVCVGCLYARWGRTKSGRLHPSGDGKCMHPLADAAAVRSSLPVAVAKTAAILMPYPWISRKKTLNDYCAAREEEADV